MSDSNEQNKAKPFSKARTQYTVGMVIYFYCVFYVIMKAFAMVQGEPFMPYLLLILPFVVLAYLGYRQQQVRRFSWAYIGVGVVLISVIRYYEVSLLRYFYENL